MDTMQGNKATMQLKRISSNVMIQFQADSNCQASHPCGTWPQASHAQKRLTPFPSPAFTCTPTELPLSPAVIPAEMATTPWENGRVTITRLPNNLCRPVAPEGHDT